MTTYKVLSVSQANNSAVRVGDIVYSLRGSDYGLASDDTQCTGIEHRSVTFKPDGDYPSFTIPVKDLEKLP